VTKSLRLPGIGPDASVRYFSLGRHALAAGLRVLGVAPKQSVLFPEFICRDLLAAVHAIGAEAVFYPVGPDLSPSSPQETWPDAVAVLAVDYFGFPQPLGPFQAYAERTGAFIVEDNAHGFLSRDDIGRWLGTRADAGIFSIRKTLPIADGAALVIGNTELVKGLGEPLTPEGRGYAPAVAWKGKLRRVPVVGVPVLAATTGLVRVLRKLRTGFAIPPPDEEAEKSIPYSSAPHSGLMAALAAPDVQKEIDRRRKLYLLAERDALAIGIVPLFPELPPLVAPYGFPFRSNSSRALRKMRCWAARRGLGLIRWPDLPSGCTDSLPEYHRSVYLVNFL